MPEHSTPRNNTKNDSQNQAGKAEKICKIADICGACEQINEPYFEALKNKFLVDAKKIGEHLDMNTIKILHPEAAPKQVGYRTYVKLAVRKDQRGALAFGLFKRGSHEIVDISDCPLHYEPINKLLPDLKELIQQAGILPYDESSHSGDLRYISIRFSRTTNAFATVFVLTRDMKNQIYNLVKALKIKEYKVESAIMNLNPDQTNAIFGSQSIVVSGKGSLKETLCGNLFEFGPTSFSQVNPWQAENIYRRIQFLAGYSQNDINTLWDLYCGVGQFGCNLLENGFNVLFAEENPDSITLAKKNVSSNYEDPSKIGKTHFLAGRFEDTWDEIPPAFANPHVIVANPSRRGLSEPARQLIADAVAKQEGDAQFFYVSCDLDTLLRDTKDLSEKGIKLRQMECFDMFPGTDKLEWLAIFT